MHPLRARSAIAALLATAACGPMSHAAIRPDLLDPATGRASPPFPAGVPERLRVAVYGDSQGNTAAHRAVVAAILAEKPDLVLFAGDAIDHLPAGHMPDWGAGSTSCPSGPSTCAATPGSPCSPSSPSRPPSTRRCSARWRRRAPSPTSTAGSRTPVRSGRPAFPSSRPPGTTTRYHQVDQAQFARIFSPPGGPELSPNGFWYSVDRGGWRFLVLDTGTDMFGDRDPMPEGGPQLAWLEERLSDADRLGLRSIVLLHVPPFSSGKEERGAPWVKKRVVEDILDRHPVALVLSGHVHAYERIVRPGFQGRPVDYVVSGGAGGRFFHVAERRVEGSVLFVEGVRNFVLLELGPDGIGGRALPVKVPGEAWRKPPSPLDTFRVGLPATSGRSPTGR